MLEALPVAIAQALIALALVVFFYFVRRVCAARRASDTTVDFKNFSGLFIYLPPEKLEFVVLVAALLAYTFAFTFGLTKFSSAYAELATGPASLYGRFAVQGWHWRPIANGLLVGLVQTALSEEIFFRGLVAKSLIRFCGFNVGNSLQALVFALVHNLLFYAGLHQIFSFTQILIFAMVFFPALIMCWYNERKAKGSIFPSWIIHGTLNVVSFFALLYFMNRH